MAVGVVESEEVTKQREQRTEKERLELEVLLLEVEALLDHTPRNNQAQQANQSTATLKKRRSLAQAVMVTRVHGTLGSRTAASMRGEKQQYEIDEMIEDFDEDVEAEPEPEPTDEEKFKSLMGKWHDIE